jgi:hypothetical protein
MMSSSQDALESHLKSGRFLAGAARSRWRLLEVEFPKVYVAIQARDAREFVLRFDCTGYPETPPTATVWSWAARQILNAAQWPRGGRVSQVFNPSWKAGAALYLPCDRQSIEGHPNWYAQYPWLIWRPSVGLVHYLEAVHEVLHSHELISQAA